MRSADPKSFSSSSSSSKSVVSPKSCVGPQGLEGSRFARWQLYRMAAGGSRELPIACCAVRARSK